MFAKRLLNVCTGLLCLAPLSALRPPSSAAQAIPVFLGKWGSPGSAPGEFGVLFGIATDALGNVYVADGGNYRIQKFSALGGYLADWGSHGINLGQFGSAEGVAVDNEGNVYVSDAQEGPSQNSRIQKFTSSGTFVLAWGSLGTADGQFNYPDGVAVDPAGRIFVADRDNFRIQVFDGDGNFIRKWATLGASTSIGGPSAISADASGFIYVVDLYNTWVEKYSNDGAFVALFGRSGPAAARLHAPRGIAIGGDGTLYVTDEGPTSENRVVMFSPSGTYVGQWGSIGSADGQFREPYGVAIGLGGSIYVADSWNQRVQVFGFPPTAARTESFGALKSRYRGAPGAAQPGTQGR